MKLKLHIIIHFLRYFVLIAFVYAMLIQPIVEIFTFNQDNLELSAFVDDENSEEEKQEEDTTYENDELNFSENFAYFYFHTTKVAAILQYNLTWDFHLKISIPPPEIA